MGGPAAESGNLFAGDQITAVKEAKETAWFGTAHRKLSDSVERIRGEEGTVVVLQVESTDPTKDQKTRSVEITRARIQFQKGRPMADIIVREAAAGDHKVGWIRVPTLMQGKEEEDASTTKDTKKLIDRLIKEKVELVLVDLRSNSGGPLTQGSGLANLFLGKKAFFQKKTRGAKTETTFSDGPEKPLWNGPLIVLTNQWTNGSAEMFAGCIQEHNRGIVVGTNQTFGQSIAAVYVPVAEDKSGKDGYVLVGETSLFRLNGQPYQRHGVTPDLQLPNLYSEQKVGARTISNSLTLDPIAPHSFQKLKDDLHLEVLRASSTSRMLASEFFQKMDTYLERQRSENDKNRVFLSLQKRRNHVEGLRNSSVFSKETLPLETWILDMQNVDNEELQTPKEGDANKLEFTSWEKEVLDIACDFLDQSKK